MIVWAEQVSGGLTVVGNTGREAGRLPNVAAGYVGVRAQHQAEAVGDGPEAADAQPDEVDAGSGKLPVEAVLEDIGAAVRFLKLSVAFEVGFGPA